MKIVGYALTSLVAISAPTTRGMATTMRIPAQLQASLPALYQTALHPLQFGVGSVAQKDETVTLLQATLSQSALSTVAFVVRRPG